nr:MAG TPA: hypothetical protein [Bacteriophage sp.]
MYQNKNDTQGDRSWQEHFNNQKRKRHRPRS